MCKAKTNAQITVINSALPHERCGGPEINDAQKVANPTPTHIIFAGFFDSKNVVNSAVKTT